jgi:hypothetical protein
LLKYLWYIIRHKYYVFVECVRLGIPFAGVTHDLSKFRPSEFFPYMRHFYGDIRRGRDATGYYKAGDTGDVAFDKAWLLHQHRNPHHWGYWVLVQEDAAPTTVEMPVRYLLEMVADWRGAGKAQGTPDTVAWYKAHKDRMIMHSTTRRLVEGLILETQEDSMPLLLRIAELFFVLVEVFVVLVSLWLAANKEYELAQFGMMTAVWLIIIIVADRSYYGKHR